MTTTRVHAYTRTHPHARCLQRSKRLNVCARAQLGCDCDNRANYSLTSAMSLSARLCSSKPPTLSTRISVLSDLKSDDLTGRVSLMLGSDNPSDIL